MIGRAEAPGATATGVHAPASTALGQHHNSEDLEPAYQPQYININDPPPRRPEVPPRHLHSGIPNGLGYDHDHEAGSEDEHDV
jgi:hypothetical protein